MEDIRTLHQDVFHLKQKPSKSTTLLTKYLPNIRVSLKSKGIENQALRYLPYAMNNAFPIDMTQFENLFHSTRIPCRGKDVIQRAERPTRHVIVLHKGKIFSIDAFGEDYLIQHTLRYIHTGYIITYNL